MAKTLFITGASTGIGAETARVAVDHGWNVALFARSAETLEEVAGDLGRAAMSLPGDVTDPEALVTAMERAAGHFGSLDAVFANAGTGLSTPGTEAGAIDEWRAMVDVNIMGLLYTARAALPHLRKSRGHLVLTGSAAGRRHIKGSIYGATKWFVHGYAGNMAEEMRDWGGRCTVVAPGMVDTPFFDDGAPDKLQPRDVADAVLHALNADPRNCVREIYLMPQN
ncbi:short-chain dehydrogenase [Brevirhabdus pacifica]|uniref:Short-chain dehydrogenase n=1 Tax=Brevirhabdus pacifica TaxID=1267768 RepID=A0A1U7DG74_9RHOB|nr:SDR family oxidoreductase [Brevirhabdus pacifica]APX88878.1 short-chain dehydrogenase [Brevirhabdus pacifica]OWU80112.1 short-chain dehydrogenase [Loktanella sp. 22II-4b]PJJ86579.1 NADP-dependent 3-hydroxy acid dehydrogenase YdfG [Brevirhabdus pacifica]